MVTDWNPIMELAGKLADLDLVVVVDSRLVPCGADGHEQESGVRMVVHFGVARSFRELTKSVYVDPETLNFLLPAGVVMEPETFLNSTYSEILAWLGLV